MADNLIRARQGDTLDALIWRDRKLGTAAFDAVLSANPGLADLGAVLPVGTPVILPTIAAAAPATVDIVQLWD